MVAPSSILPSCTQLALLCFAIAAVVESATSAAGFAEYIYNNAVGGNCSGTPSRIRSYAPPTTCNAGANSSAPVTGMSTYNISFDTTVLGTAQFVMDCNTGEIHPCNLCQPPLLSQPRFAKVQTRKYVCSETTVELNTHCVYDNCTMCATVESHDYVSADQCVPSGRTRFSRPNGTWATAQPATSNATTGIYYYAAATAYENDTCTGSLGPRGFGCNTTCVFNPATNESSVFVCTGLAESTPPPTGLTLTPQPARGGAAALTAAGSLSMVLLFVAVLSELL